MSWESLFPRVWAVWLLVGILIEGAALMQNTRGATLSEFVWRFLDGGPARWLLFLGLLTYTVAHFLGRGRWG